jgi:hypothetical protein
VLCFVCLICGTAIKIIFTIGPDILRMYISRPVVLPFTKSSFFLILKYLNRLVGWFFEILNLLLNFYGDSSLP